MDDEFRRYCLEQERKRPVDKVSGPIELKLEPKKKGRRIQKKYDKDIPRPLYFVTLHHLTQSAQIFEVDLYNGNYPDGRKVPQSVRIAYEKKDKSNRKDFKWIGHEKKWVEVELGTRITAKDGPKVLPFYMLKEFEPYLVEIEGDLGGKIVRFQK